MTTFRHCSLTSQTSTLQHQVAQISGLEWGGGRMTRELRMRRTRIEAVEEKEE